MQPMLTADEDVQVSSFITDKHITDNDNDSGWHKMSEVAELFVICRHVIRLYMREI